MGLRSSYTGTTKLKRFDGQYGTSYYAQMSKKNKDGKWQNAGKKIKFKKDVEFNDGDEIEIISAFETFNMNPQTKKPSFYIFCMEFKPIEKIVDNDFVADTGTAEVEFEDIGFDSETPF